MKKIILFFIFVLFLIPNFCYAWDDMGFYASVNSDCGTNGKFNYSTSNGWEPHIGTKNSIVSTPAKTLMFYVKRDLDLGITYDIKITATDKDFVQAINANSIRFYNVDSECSNTNFINGIESNDISLVSISNKASTGSYVNTITLRIFSASLHPYWILFIQNPTLKNITLKNWGIKNIQIQAVDTTGSNAIIEANNNNTNNIIDNNNTNTQSIIDNQNSNNQALIDNQNRLAEEQKQQNQVCKSYSKSDIYYNNKWLGGNGTLNDSTNYGVTDYLTIDNNSEIFIYNIDYGISTNICFYDNNKDFISCSGSTSYLNNQQLTIPTNGNYIRFGIDKRTNKPLIKICKNGNTAITDTFTDDSVPTGNDYFDDFNDMLPTNNTISSLIALPISLYSKVLNSINGTCSSISLGSLYNTELVMPCINLQQYLGTTLWNTLDLIMSGAFVLVISKKMIKAFHNFTSMKDGDVINND